MHEQSTRLLAKKLRIEGKTYSQIDDISGLSIFSSKKLCIYERKPNKKRGPKFKIDNRSSLAIKRQILHISKAARKF